MRQQSRLPTANELDHEDGRPRKSDAREQVVEGNLSPTRRQVQIAVSELGARLLAEDAEDIMKVKVVDDRREPRHALEEVEAEPACCQKEMAEVEAHSHCRVTNRLHLAGKLVGPDGVRVADVADRIPGLHPNSSPPGAHLLADRAERLSL